MSAVVQIGPKGLAQPADPSPLVQYAVSKQTRQYVDSALGLRSVDAPSTRFGRPETDEQRVFHALATAKVLTSQVAMHLEKTWREKLFKQLDLLHETDDWEAGDKPVDKNSYATFLKAIIALKVSRRPGLGMSAAGNLIAAWTAGPNRLTLEFLPNAKVQWIVGRTIADEEERAAGVTPIRRLAAVLAPYSPEVWFADANPAA